MDNLQKTIREYQLALEAELSLTQQENVIKTQRIAARERLNIAKRDLWFLESDIRSFTPSST